MVVVMSSMVCVSTLPVAIYVHVNRDSSLKRTANSSAKVRSQIMKHLAMGMSINVLGSIHTVFPILV